VETSPDLPPGIVDAAVAAIAGLTGIATLGHLRFTPNRPRQVRAFTLLSGSRTCPEQTAAPFCSCRRQETGPIGALPECHRAARKEDRGQRAQGPAVLRGSLASAPPFQAARDLVFAAPPFNLAASPDAWSCCSRHVHGKVGW